MCLHLSLAEAGLWLVRALELFDQARIQAASHPADPILVAHPGLSRLVTEIDGVKKRHGRLIEDALIFAINRRHGWIAGREAIPVAPGRVRSTDCLAYESASGRLYHFECKRGHGVLDADSGRSMDDRLDEIAAALPAFAASKGWDISSISSFVLSFYGRTESERHPVYDRYEVDRLFGPCVRRFFLDFVEYTEHLAGLAYGDIPVERHEVPPQLPLVQSRRFENLFLLLERLPPGAESWITFDGERSNLDGFGTAG